MRNKVNSKRSKRKRALLAHRETDLARHDPDGYRGGDWFVGGRQGGGDTGYADKGYQIIVSLRLELQVLRGAHFEKRGRTYLTELIRCYRSLTDMPQVS